MEARDLEVLAWRLFEESNDAVFVLDSETETIRQANPTAQKLTGLRWRQLRGRGLGELVRCDHDGQMTKLLSAVRETGFFHSQEEYLLLCHQSDPLPINISASRIHAPSGELGLVVLRDISERKRAELALREFNNELELRVLARTNELRVANEQLTAEIEERVSAEQAIEDTNEQLRKALGRLERAHEQAIRRERLHALEQIAGGVAHDINNSLSAVTVFSELILRKELDDQTHQWAASVHAAAKDIAGIVRRLRQFYGNRVDRETSERIDLARLAKEVVHLTSPKWCDESLRRRKGITVTVNAEAAPSISGDASALRSALTNLIFNSVDAVDVTGRITVRIAEQSGVAVIEVHDNGIGMTHDERRRCLEPFYTTKTKGTGLGLSICHGIAKSHGGRIEIDSVPGEGSAIRLLLPVTTAPGQSPSSEDSELAPTDGMAGLLKGKKILFIDDNQAARESTLALLTSMGMVVNAAEDGHSGLAMFREQCYDAVITDMSMPGMDGLQLTAELKLLQPSIPVLMISGWLSIHSHRETDSLQPDSVLCKPLASDELTDTLIQLLSRDVDRGSADSTDISPNTGGARAGPSAGRV